MHFTMAPLLISMLWAGGCNSMAQIGDVVYHEYGHGINDKFYQSLGGSFNNGGMGEGYADIWALGITETLF